MGEINISKMEYESLTKDLSECRSNFQANIDKIRREESEKSAKAISAATKNLELISKAANAVLNASNEQKDREIISLQATINELHFKGN